MLYKPGSAIPPAVYTIKKEKKEYSIEYKHHKFETPDKVYGAFNKYSKRFFRTYRLSNSSVGVILTGEKGSGKSLLAELVSNMAIENGIAVIWVYSIKIDDELMNFLSTFNNAVIYVDEFGKLADIRIQDRALTTMSSTTTGKRLFIITENNKNRVSEFMRNRPGRMKYNINFDRIDTDTFNEYIADFNIEPNFLKSLKEDYNRSLVFTFDHLQAIVAEHLMYPEDTYKEISNILNVDVMGKDAGEFVIQSIVDEAKPEEGEEAIVYETSGTKLSLDKIKVTTMWVPYRVKGTNSYFKEVKIHKNDAITVTDNLWVFRSEGKIITFVKVDV